MLKRACFFGTHTERRGEGGPGRCLGKPLGSFIHIVAHVSFLTLLLKNTPDWNLCADLVLKLCAPIRSARIGKKKKERESGTCGSERFVAKSINELGKVLGEFHSLRSEAL